MATLGCIKAVMGNTTYYMSKIAAGELIDKVGIAKELPEWENMTADEKMQREYDIKRIIEEIVPYVVEDPDLAEPLEFYAASFEAWCTVNFFQVSGEVLVITRRDGSCHCNILP